MIQLITVFMAFILTMATSSYAGGGTSANSPPVDPPKLHKGQSGFGYAVLPYDHYHEEDGLPPVLQVTFQLKCFQQFVKIIRHDETDAATGKVVIAVGILVREDLLSICESAHDETVNAGTTFSGREYSIVPIQ